MNVPQATINDAEWIADLSQRVQTTLTAGSLQKIGPLPISTVEASIQAGTAVPGSPFTVFFQRKAIWLLYL